MKRFLKAITLVALFSMLFSTMIFADTTKPVNAEPATIGIAPDNGMPETPGGVLTEKELKEIDKNANEFKHIGKEGSGDVSTTHFNLSAHVHYFDNIYNRYDGYRDRGEVASGYNGKPTVDTLNFTIEREVSNSWSTTIEFTDGVVSSGVGYSVTWKEKRSWGYSASVNPYKTVHIGYQDWYHVQEYNCHTTWNFNGYITTEYGTGWAEQWYKPHFYSWET